MIEYELCNRTIYSVFQASLRRVIIVHGSVETLFNLICHSSEAGLSQRRLVWLLIVSDVTSSSSHLKADCSIPWNDILVFNTVSPVFDSKVSLVEVHIDLISRCSNYLQGPMLKLPVKLTFRHNSNPLEFSGTMVIFL